MSAHLRLIRVSLVLIPGGLGGWAGGIKLPFVNGPFVPSNEGCVQGELRVSGFSSFLVFGVPKKFSGGSVRDMKEKERVRRALLSGLAGFPSKFLE